MTPLFSSTTAVNSRVREAEPPHTPVVLAVVTAIMVAIFGLASPRAGVCGDVQGVVSDAVTGLPIAGATVILWETHDTVTTNGSGEYFFAAIPTGATLIFGKQGYGAGVGSAV